LGLNCDATAAKAIAEKPGLRAVKHISIKLLFLQDWISRKVIKIKKIPTDKNPADLLTKHLQHDRLQQLLRSIGATFEAQEEIETEAEETNHLQANQSNAAAGAFATALLTFFASLNNARGQEESCPGEQPPEQGPQEAGEDHNKSYFTASLLVLLGIVLTLFFQWMLRPCQRLRDHFTEDEVEEAPEAELQGPEGVLTVAVEVQAGRGHGAIVTQSGTQVNMPPLTATPFAAIEPPTTTRTVHVPPTRVYTTTTGSKFHAWSCSYLTVARKKQHWKEWGVCTSCAGHHEYPTTATTTTRSTGSTTPHASAGGATSSTTPQAAAVQLAAPQMPQQLTEQDSDAWFRSGDRDHQDKMREMWEGHDSDSDPPNPEDWPPPSSRASNLRYLNSEYNPTEASEDEAEGDEEQAD